MCGFQETNSFFSAEPRQIPLEHELSAGDLEVIDEGEEVLIQAENERRRLGNDSRYKFAQAQSKGLSRRDVELLSKW